MLALNINQEAKKVIFDRFNALNSLQLNPDDFIMDPAEAYSNPTLDTNTRVKVTPLALSSSYNLFYIYYNRMDLADICDRINIEIKSSGLASLIQILDVINIELGVYMTIDDLIETDIIYDDPSDLTARATLFLEAKDTSYLFKGSFSLLLNERINPYDPSIKNAITGVAMTSNGSTTNIVNLNTSISEESYFNFLERVIINTPPVIYGVRLVGDGAYVFGQFDIEPPTTMEGAQGSNIYNAVTINRIGQVTSVDRVARFDNVYQKDVCFKPKPDQSKYYLADQNKYVTGNVASLYRYNVRGERDNSLITTDITFTVDKVLPLASGFIATSVNQASLNNGIEIKKFKETGSIDPDMLPIEISDAFGIEIDVQGIVPSYDAGGAVDGFYVLLRNIFSQPITPMVNGTRVYGNKHRNKNNYILPILKFTIEGILDTTFKGNLSNANKDFFKPEVGVFHFERLFAIKDGIIIFNRVRNPITGVYTLISLKIDAVGNIEFLNGGDYFDLPIVKSVSSVVQNNNTFLASVIVEEIDNNNVIVEQPMVIGYDSFGKYTGIFLELESPMNFIDMVVFKN